MTLIGKIKPGELVLLIAVNKNLKIISDL
jgi:hypothetical protein